MRLRSSAGNADSRFCPDESMALERLRYGGAWCGVRSKYRIASYNQGYREGTGVRGKPKREVVYRSTSEGALTCRSQCWSSHASADQSMSRLSEMNVHESLCCSGYSFSSSVLLRPHILSILHHDVCKLLFPLPGSRYNLIIDCQCREITEIARLPANLNANETLNG